MGFARDVIRTVKTKASEASRAPRRRSGLARLAERPDGAVLLAALDGRRVPGEELWVERIEAVRREYLAREDSLTVHGAEFSGDPADERSETDTVAELCRTGSRPPVWSLMLLRLTHALRPTSAIELGTLLGISAAYQAAGLELAGHGRLLSMDASGERLAVARETVDRLGLGARVEFGHGRFQATLTPALERLGEVGYAFIDGHHDEQATLDYTGAILDRAQPGAHLVVDDTLWSEGMTRAWRALAADPRVGLAVDLGGMGVLVAGGEPELVDLPLR